MKLFDWTRFFTPLLACLLALCAYAADPGVPRDVYVGKGMFGDIIVYDDAQGFRTLEFKRGAGRHSLVKLGDPLHLEFEYARIVSMAPALSRQPPERILILGLGGGSLPMYFRAVFPAANIDVAEIDPAVVNVAERFFGFKQDAKLRAHVGDGRAFVERAAPASYDIIVLDAFGEEAVPRHLATLEFMRAVRAALRPDGVALSNVWGPDFNKQYFDMLATHAAAYDSLHAVYAPNNVNVMLFALPRKESLTQAELTRRVRALGGAPLYRFDLGALVERAWLDPMPGAGRGQVLRDAAR